MHFSLIDGERGAIRLFHLKKESKVILYKRQRCNNENDSHVDPVCAEFIRDITKKFAFGSLTTKIFKIVKLYGSSCMYDKQKIEKERDR